MEISLLSPKCTLVPSNFYDPERVSDSLAEVVSLELEDEVEAVEIPQYDAVLLYAANASTERSIVSETEDSGGESVPRPELFYVLRSLENCKEYNKILCSWRGGYLYLAIAQGKTLLLANVFKAGDFVTAEYFIFLSMKKLQLNPEISTICFRHPLESEDEMSLYRYFKAVETL